jgi:GT2 family glycosyltransferase
MVGAPKVRVLIVNFDGGELTLRCLEAVRTLDWPQDALEVVVVDNASIDGIAPQIRKEMPWVHLIENTHNAGFAGGCNLGLADIDGVDYVALLNNDAIPERQWLRELVAVMEQAPDVGATNSKIVFAPTFVSVALESPTFSPVHDGRGLGVRVTGLEVEGADVLEHAQFAGGFHSSESRGTSNGGCWSGATGELRVPIEPGRRQPDSVKIELSAETDKDVVLRSGEVERTVTVARKPQWFEAPLAGETYDVINNVGSRLVEGGYGGDRGFLEPDVGQYERCDEVFAWCGAATLLSRRYLQDVGIFDGRYFVYYEDTDLSWRGRLAGWRYLYVPESVVRHVHAATSSEGSTLFAHFVERNRLLTLARNAPVSLVVEASARSLRDTAAIVRRDVVRRLLARRRPSVSISLARLRAFAAFLKLLAPTLASRSRQQVSRAGRRRVVKRWMVPR